MGSLEVVEFIEVWVHLRSTKGTDVVLVTAIIEGEVLSTTISFKFAGDEFTSST